MKPKPMVQWEYVCIHRNDDWEFLEEINNYGKAGWEVIAIHIERPRHTAYLKKQKNL